MTRIRSYIPKTNFAKEVASQDSIISQNIKILGKNGFRFSKGLAQMVRDPGHIVGKFFREISFEKDWEIFPLVKERLCLLANTLNSSFHRYISALQNIRQEHWLIMFSASKTNGKIILSVSDHKDALPFFPTVSVELGPVVITRAEPTKELAEQLIDEVVGTNIIDDRAVIESTVETLARLGKIDRALSFAADDGLKCSVLAVLLEEGKANKAAAVFREIEFRSQGTKLSEYMRASFFFSNVTEEQTRAFMEECGLRYFIPLDIKSTDTIEMDEFMKQAEDEIIEDFRLKLAETKKMAQEGDFDTAAALFEAIFCMAPAELGPVVLKTLCEIDKKDWAIIFISERFERSVEETLDDCANKMEEPGSRERSKFISILSGIPDAAQEAARSFNLIGEREQAREMAEVIWENMPMFKYRTPLILAELGDIDLSIAYARSIEDEVQRKLALVRIAQHLAKTLKT